MKKTSDISIVVSNYNSSDLLNGALESIVSTAGEMIVDVTIVDDASTDGGFDHVDKKFKKDSRFLFIQNDKNIGQSAMNVMFDKTQGKYILMLDADARLHTSSLQELFSFMEAHPEAGGATANLLNSDGSPQLYYRRTMTPTAYFFTTLFGRFIDKYILGLSYFNWYRYIHLDTTHVSELEQPPMACLILRRKILRNEIMDPKFRMLFIDIDLAKRVYDYGYKLYLVSEAFVTHLKSASFAKRESAWRRNIYYVGLFIYMRKHYPYWFPLVWVLAWADRVARAILTRIIGRELLR